MTLNLHPTRLLPIVVGLGMIAGFTAVVAGPAAATPPVSCHGQPATIVGTNGDETLTGTGGRDIIAGRGGRDRIDGKGGNDLICGGPQRDTIGGGADNDRVYGGGGRDVLNGGGGADAVHGDGGRDEVQEHGDGNSIVGGAGFDQVWPHGGGDVIHADYVDYVFQPNGVTVDLAAGTATGKSIGKDRLSGVRTVIGTDHADVLSGDGADNRLLGAYGDDYIDGRGGDDQIDGRNGSLATQNLSDDDTLIGGAGNDALGDDGEDDAPYDSSDSMHGGAGNDWFTVGQGTNTIDGGAGSDTFQPETNTTGYSLNIDLAAGFADSDVSTNSLTSIENAYGSFNSDVIHGSDADNHLYGWSGDDAIYGEGGNDMIDAGENFHDLSPGDFADGGDGDGDAYYATTTTNCESAAAP